MGMHWSELDVWKEAHQLVLETYIITKGFPKEEQYALTSQMRRAGYSIPLNIVEGYSRQGTKEYLQFLNIAKGSLEELRYIFMLSRDLNYITANECLGLEKKAEIVSKLLNGLIKALKGKLK
jgi:four helix bundle protein